MSDVIPPTESNPLPAEHPAAIAGAVAQAVSDIAKAQGSLIADMHQSVSDMANAAVNARRDARGEVRAEISLHPVTSVLIAAGFGLVGGLVAALFVAPALHG